MTSAGHNCLADLAERVRDATAAMHTASREAAERALEAGRLLIEAKQECPHGEWLLFLDKVGMAERQAQRLMRLAKSGLKSDTVSDLGIKGALEFLAKWKLPTHGNVLVVSLNSQPVRERSAFVWESEEHPGYFHVAGIRPECAGLLATRKPIAREAPEIVLRSVEAILEQDGYGDMQFQTLPMSRKVCEEFRLVTMATSMGIALLAEAADPATDTQVARAYVGLADELIRAAKAA